MKWIHSLLNIRGPKVTRHKVQVDENVNGVHINPDEKTKTADFEVNLQTGKLLLPAKYIKLLELKVF